MGHLTAEMDAGAMLLGMIALSWFPLAFPQLTRLITGQAVSETRFRKQQRKFLSQFAAAFQAANEKRPTVEPERKAKSKRRSRL